MSLLGLIPALSRSVTQGTTTGQWLKITLLRLVPVAVSGILSARFLSHPVARIQPRQRYRQRVADHRQRGIHDDQLILFRWMLEEFRVSLFAQELRTSMPVSAKRLQRQWSATSR